MIKIVGDRERVRKRERERMAYTKKETNQTNKQTNQNDLWNFFGSLAKMQGICGNLLELYLLYKIVTNQKKIWLLFAISSFRRIDLSHSHGTKPQNNTKTNDNGNCNLACFIQTHYFQYADIYAIP